MSFRARLLLAFLLAASVPLAVFGLGVRREMSKRLTAQYELRVESLLEMIEADLEDERRSIARKLDLIEASILDDNRFRLAALAGVPAERGYLLDYARGAMRLAGLSMLQIQDDQGRIISSGHFRNEYDALEPELPDLLARSQAGTALVQARTPEEPFIALARVDSFRLAGRTFHLVGGTAVDRGFLSRLTREGELNVTLDYPGGPVPAAELSEDAAGPAAGGSVGQGTPDALVRELVLPFIGSEAQARGVPDQARIIVRHQMRGLAELRRGVDLWFVIAITGIALVTLILAAWLSARVSRPLADLARKTSRIDLDRLDVRFESRRRDEIGTLSRVLGTMTGRLRASAARLREAERRATIGELARQVNHDIKNGLTPIRNVFRHLGEVARERRETLPDVFEERSGTIESGIAYLERLSSSYARLYPHFEHRPTDPNEIVRRVLAHFDEVEGVEIRAELDGGVPAVVADPLVLRRIVENLVSNAVESLDGSGKVIVATRRADGEADPTVQIEITDTGVGIIPEERARIFDDFFTTKEKGTGLGLSIVRRLVTDLNGTVRVESQPGIGSRFTVELPAAEAADSTEREEDGEG